MTSSNGNIFRVTGLSCGELTGHRWIPRKGQWRRALRFSICTWINRWVDNREDGEMRRDRAHYDVTVMILLGQRMYWMCSNSKITTKRYGIYDYDIHIYIYTACYNKVFMYILQKWTLYKMLSQCVFREIFEICIVKSLHNEFIKFKLKFH